MATWLLKTEPNDYSYDDLIRDKKTVWDGVKNNLALIHIRNVKKGDTLLIYHTGKEKQLVGIAKAISNAYADPEKDDPKLAVFDLKPVRAVKQPVPLSAIKADATFKDFKLVTFSRLSVMPVPANIEKKLMAMSG